MGIYPTTEITDRVKHPNGSETWTETYNDHSGCIRTRTVKAEPYTKRRVTCYCCSCGEREGSDPYCRNHGWAGTRPCDLHGTPGQEDDDGGMPDSVQVERARNEAKEAKYR